MLRWRKFWWFIPFLTLLFGLGVGLGEPLDAEAKRRKGRPGKAAKGKRGRKGKKGKRKSKGKTKDAPSTGGYQENLPPSVIDELPPIGSESGPDPRKATLRTDKTHTELRKHLHRMAKIDRIEQIARNRGDAGLQSKAEELRTLELRRHNLAVAALNAPPAPEKQ